MKLNAVQIAWVLACLALFAAMLLDIVGAVRVPSLYWTAGTGLLLLTGWRVMPSMAELKAMQRRRIR